MAEEPVAGVTDLHISFDGRPVVSGVSFELAAGECLALVGESGSGKTLTSRALLGLVPETAAVRSERLEIAGRDARRFTARQWQELRGSTVGLIAQDALVSLDPLRTVGREVAEALRVRRRRERARLTRTELDTAVAAELTHVAVPEPQQRMRQYAHELSGGLRQRALIASATITEPQLLIADEPTTALDRGVQAQVLQVLGRLKAEGAALLLISHDLAVVASIADQVAVMRAGEVVETGPVDAVLRQPSHDYTVTLLRAQPSAHSRGRRLSEQPRLELGPVSHSRETQPVVLAARGLRQSFRQPDGSRLQAVDEVSFELPAGQTLGIVGESGSGKTTVGRILLGLQPPEAGEVELAGELWTGVPERKRRPRRHLIQAIHQDPLSSFDPRVSVRSILTEALAIHGVARADRPERAAELLGWVGLSTDLLPRRPLTLSGGQRQRLAIARALAREPQVLICDEPVSALDVSVQAQVLDVFTDIQDQLGLAMVFISHDLGVVHHLSDEVLVMQQGVVVERGAATEVFTDPQHSYTRSLLEALPELDVDPAVLVPTDPEPDPDEGSD